MRVTRTTENSLSARRPDAGETARGVEGSPWAEDRSDPGGQKLIERMVEAENMRCAWRQVKSNRGAPGVDGRDIDDTAVLLRKCWPRIKQRLLDETYRPQPVRRVEIPKPGGGVRKLGVPTVLDRLIQQAMHQVLSPLFEPTFSDRSYGFRPGRSAHQAVVRARGYQCGGKRWVVDMDLKQFFDEVNHDILMSRVGRKVSDKRMKRLIGLYLKSGVLTNGVVVATHQGTPQGGPLSPLLSNILLDDLDKELERRGHAFCRYADDCNIYVNSRRAGERVLASVTRHVEDRLKLKVNTEKSVVGRPWERVFLGYSFTMHKATKLRVPPKSVKRIRAHIKTLCRQGRGRNLWRFINEDLNPVLRGWIQYFRLADVKGFAQDLDQWIRRRLRCILWRQWKRRWTRFKRLVSRGLDIVQARRSAFNGRGPWWNAGASHMNAAYQKRDFDGIGLVSLLDTLLKFRIVTS